MRGCSPEGGSGRPENITGTVNVLRRVVPDTKTCANLVQILPKLNFFLQELEPRGAQIDQNGALEVARGDIGGPDGTEDEQRSSGEKCPPSR